MGVEERLTGRYELSAGSASMMSKNKTQSTTMDTPTITAILNALSRLTAVPLHRVEECPHLSTPVTSGGGRLFDRTVRLSSAPARASA